MCGVTGLWTDAAVELDAHLERMTDALAHRGPDSRGTWREEGAGLGLGHRRLSIVDLSAEGHQPMLSGHGRFVAVFNGEIYNFEELRAQLDAEGQDVAWRGHSDTEVALAAFEAWGVETALRRFNGMFAFGIWDRRERCLWLARDRFGEKPLYLFRHARGIAFASELKALRHSPGWREVVSPDALASLLGYNYVPTPLGIFAGVTKLEPGVALCFARPTEEPRRLQYFSAVEVARRALASPLPGSDQDHVDQVERVLRRAVALRMHADVPLGAFLSGGIDSSTVVALMQDQSPRAVRTFTIGFTEAAYDESPQAAAVARHLGTQHTELILQPADALAVIPRLPALYDEPFADASQIPTFLVSQLARRHVTVTLSGDGGDELFGGYNRHAWLPRVWRRASRIPSWIRRGVAAALTVASPGQWDGIFEQAGRVFGQRALMRGPGEKLHKLARALDARSPLQLYDRISGFWPDPASLLRLPSRPRAPSWAWDRTLGLSEATMLADTLTYLPDDILVKVDRASMGVSLESRVPMLDPDVFELSWRLPVDRKLRGGVTKWALRQVLHRYVPADLVERPKCGFGIPIDAWLRGPLRDWAEALLDPSRLRQDGFFEVAPIRAAWETHLSGRTNLQYHLWSVLMFQAWREAWNKGA